jgi:serine/threonine protein kinase
MNFAVRTVTYSAPEQLMRSDIDGRADQYALAATAYHLLTGSQLFPNSNPGFEADFRDTAPRRSPTPAPGCAGVANVVSSETVGTPAVVTIPAAGPGPC